jgi:DNA-directed RNA polymerase subunit RPC12/RpoP
MADLVDREALKSAIFGLTVCPGYEREYISAMFFAINNAPSVDAEPVRHSRWRKAGLERLYYCHDCGRYADMKYEGNLKVENLYRYCPHCGAKMQEGVERE